MIDLHCHILPGIDDGPSTTEQSIILGRSLVDAGVSIVAATPHLRADYPNVVPVELADRCADLQAALDDARVMLKVVPAAEVDLLWALAASSGDLALASYDQNGSDLLLETPYGALPPQFEEHLFKLALAGYRVLLAHPERNPTFQSEPQRLADLVRRGVLVQITASSLSKSPRRSRSARLAGWLLRSSLVHVIASDAHGTGGSVRDAHWAAGLEAAVALVGPRTDWLVNAAPRAILSGISIEASNRPLEL